MKYILYAFVILLFCSCEEPVDDPFAISNTTRDSIYLKVHELCTAGNYQDAERLLSTIRARDMYDHTYFVYNAKVKFRLEKYAEAIHFVNSDIKMNYDVGPAYYMKANCYASMNLMDSAIVYLNKAIAVDSTNPDYLMPRIKYYLDNKLAILAIDDANTLVRKDSTSPAFLSSLAVCKYALADTVGAYKIFSLILDLDPKNLNAIKSLGFINFHKKNFSEAMLFFDRYNQIEPTNGEIYFTMAEIQDYQGKVEKACDNLLKAIDLGYPAAHKRAYKCADHFRKKGIEIRIRKDTLREPNQENKISEI